MTCRSTLTARMLACQADMLGMEAENEYRKRCGNQVAYTEMAFQSVADELREIARAFENLDRQSSPSNN